MFILKSTEKENVDSLLRLRIPGIGKHPYCLTSKSPRQRREHLNFTLAIFFNFADLGIQDSSGSFLSICLYCPLSMS